MSIDQMTEETEPLENEQEQTAGDDYETEQSISEEEDNPDAETAEKGEGKQKAAWMLTEEEEQDTGRTMPIAAHIETRERLKGRIAERDSEIEKLRQEIQSLKTGGTVPAQMSAQTLKRPDPLDYNTDAEYDAALNLYEESILEERYKKMEARKAYEGKVQEVNRTRKRDVDAHYDRAAKLISESGIEVDVYKDSDHTVRQAIDNIMPRQGDAIADQMISMLGEGSEKVMYYLGRNRNALNEFKVLLSEDPSGLKAAIYLGQQKARLLEPAKMKSNAPKPGRQIQGDQGVGNQANASDLKKRYDKFHKSGKVQEAYDIKRKAKIAGVQTANW